MNPWQKAVAIIRSMMAPREARRAERDGHPQSPQVLPAEAMRSSIPRSVEEAQAKAAEISSAVGHAHKLHQLGMEGEEEKALWEMVKDTEREAKREGWCPAPHAYERLAILYRKQKRFDDEIAILQRWLDKAGDQVNDDSKIRARIQKAEALRDKAHAKVGR